jgi:hypothetical protein
MIEPGVFEFTENPMPGLPAGVMHEWHDFYALLGTASATLVGLMFVAASIGANIFDEQHRAPMRLCLHGRDHTDASRVFDRGTNCWPGYLLKGPNAGRPLQWAK